MRTQTQVHALFLRTYRLIDATANDTICEFSESEKRAGISKDDTKRERDKERGGERERKRERRRRG